MTNGGAVVRHFASLFAGRTDAYGSEVGGCVREYPPFRGHLTGEHSPIGIYNLCDGNAVKWGAIDIDYDDMQEAVNVYTLLGQVGIPSYIEVSRSKGYHVWVFVEDWIAASTMRRALCVVRDFLNLKAREVYPKQEAVDPNKPFGNYLRLPYPGWLGDDHEHLRRTMIQGQARSWRSLSLEEFLASVEYAKPEDLERLAARYVVPTTSPVALDATSDFTDDAWIAAGRDALRRLDDALSWHIFNNGPRDDVVADRSGTLMRLCHRVMIKGATIEDAYAILLAADMQGWCQKFCVRNDGFQRISEIVVKVYEQGRD